MFHSKQTGHTYRGRVGEVQIPAELAGIVTVVTGLDNRRLVKRGVRHATCDRPPRVGRRLVLPPATGPDL